MSNKTENMKNRKKLREKLAVKSNILRQMAEIELDTANYSIFGGEYRQSGNPDTERGNV